MSNTFASKPVSNDNYPSYEQFADEIERRIEERIRALQVALDQLDKINSYLDDLIKARGL